MSEHTSFEYKIVSASAGGFLGGKIDFDKLSERINKLGRDGWELVSTEDTAKGQGTTRDLALFFKREIR